MNESIESTSSNTSIQPQPESQSITQQNSHSAPHHHHHHHLHHVHHNQHSHPTNPHHHHHIVHHHHHPPHQHHNHNNVQNNNNNIDNTDTNNVNSNISTTNNSTNIKNNVETSNLNSIIPINHTTKLTNSRRIPKLNIEPIENIIKELFPHRRFLGTITYNPTTTWETIQTSNLYGISKQLHQRFEEIKKNYIKRLNNHDQILYKKYIPCIPPLPKEYINSIIEIKIPYRFIIEFKQDLNNEILNRELWGGASGIYTDDSDILQVLLHMGFFNNTINLKVWNKKWNSKDIIKPIYFENYESLKIKRTSSDKNKENQEENPKENQEENNTNKEEIQMIDDEVYGDLSVQILLLPPLPKYYGFFANGINSRSWNIEQPKNQQHNGLSFVIYNINWEKRNSFLQNKIFHELVQNENYNDFDNV
ncbi:hypothetical protein KGF54_004714 [Candida jiufengensis]|uniref:uncharacterized protein n=1 Tax=Candida jiufengensis TaxID=497108 RepID=UPI002224E8DB|nr:uncharacterized protein KGF54_004714 [Candida jiufengensis]KAI5951640.1 hypothetical protein KGF54_004714 [Candida jiufengensis]